MNVYGVRMETTCAVHRHRELVPINRHHVWPEGMGGPTADWNLVTVCENGHGAIHALLDLLLKNGGVLPWAIRRRFGRGVRKYAQLGYDRIQARGQR